MEMEWKWNGDGMEKKNDKLSGSRIWWNGIEWEWKWNGKCG